MSNQLTKVFNGSNVRIVELNGEFWFVAKDVCDILEISKHRDALSRLDEDERGSVVVDTLGGKQNVGAVNEYGLYSLVFNSRKPEAKEFKRWVTHEVLPSIRKTGSYNVQPKLPTTYKEALLALVEEVEKNEALTNDNLILTQQVTEYKPKVEYVDTILNNPSLLNITQIAKDYGMSGAKMNALLSSLKVQYKSSGQWLLYSNHQSFGYTQSDTTSYVDKGITKTKLRTKWTQKGRLFIYELLKKNGILPLIEK